MVKKRLIVIGGGAAGFFGAIACARRYPDGDVVVLEAGKMVLSKVRISGGGRCNVTHHCFEPAELVRHYPRGHKALRGAFSRFQPRDVVAWFQAESIALKTEADGRMFPVTDQSETIVKALTQAAKRSGVKVFTQARGQTITVIEAEDDKQRFQVELKNGETLSGDRLLIATGSHPLGHRWAEALGHHVERPVPSLFTFNVKLPGLTQLAGVSFPLVKVSLTPTFKGELMQQGPLLITHWGLSGPAILKLSAWGARHLFNAGYQHPLWINWLPQFSWSDIETQLRDAKQAHPRQKISQGAGLPVPKSFWRWLLTRAEIQPPQVWADFSKTQQHRLMQLLQRDELSIQGKGVFKDEFVTCGGVALKEVNFKTLESRCCPGLHFAGEVLDVDGVTGGFNFQNAWTTGWLAGQAIAAALAEDAP